MLSKKKTLVLILLAIAILAAVKGHSVQKRFTCDILGSGMACGAHCLLIGKSGGYCDAGTCYCLNSGAKGGRR